MSELKSSAPGCICGHLKTAHSNQCGQCEFNTCTCEYLIPASVPAPVAGETKAVLALRYIVDKLQDVSHTGGITGGELYGIFLAMAEDALADTAKQ